MDNILTTEGAAKYLHLNKNTLEHFRVAGSGPLYCQPGGKGAKVLYRRADLDAWIERRIVSSTSEAA